MQGSFSNSSVQRDAEGVDPEETPINLIIHLISKGLDEGQLTEWQRVSIVIAQACHPDMADCDER